MSTSCLLVVPMKDPTASKTRLSGSLPTSARARLSRLLFQRTLAVLQDTQLADVPFDIAVVTASEYAAGIARAKGVTVIPEGPGSSLSLAVDTAAHWAVEQKYRALAVLPTDLAAPDPQEICQFLRLGLQSGQPVLCPSTDMGTNAIMVSPPDCIRFSYGPNSAIRHRMALAAAGQTPVLLPLESLRFDIDTSACLDRAAQRDPDIAALRANTA